MKFNTENSLNTQAVSVKQFFYQLHILHNMKPN